MDGEQQRQIDRNRRDLDNLQDRMRDVEIAVAATPFIQEDVAEIRASCEATKNLLTEQNERHRAEVAQKEKEERAAEIEEKKLTWQQIGIIGTIVTGLIAAVIAAIASLIAAGVL